MAGYFLAAEDATSWPDAALAIAFLVFLSFVFWLLFHD